jgi:mono/diheme cytochrome c family protein
MAIPRPYRDPLPDTPTPSPTTAAVAVLVEPTPEDHLTLMALGLEQVPASSVQEGSRLFSTTCTACHGSDAKGILGLGKPLIDSPFVDRLNDDELVAFLVAGRMTTDPQNTTGVVMPAKGGNPSLTDDNLNAIVDYIRSLNGAAVVNDVVGVPTAIPTLKPFQAIDLGSFASAETTPLPEVTSVTPNTPSVEATPAEPTPVISYGYNTASATATPSLPSVAATPTTAYNYDIAPAGTNVPPIYTYEAQGQP